ncbi:MAG TPA: flagellin [Mycobacteriales bacterium]|nr:flagellin [Mycobacteriales bacterium]
MALVVNTNVAALDAYRNLTVSSMSMDSSMQKLSSGSRINSAADDASGLVISENLKSQVGGLKVAINNAQDGISVTQTADGALTEVDAMLQRMRDLAVQSANAGANGGNTGNAVAAAQAEVAQLISEVTDIANNTQFNGQSLLNVATTLTFQVGANAGQTIDVTTADVTASTLGISAIDFTTAAGAASAAISTIDAAISTVNTFRGTLGATQNRLQDVVSNLSVTAQNLTASESRISDTDMAEEMTNYTKNQILVQAGTAMLAQANSSASSVLTLLKG